MSETKSNQITAKPPTVYAVHRNGKPFGAQRASVNSALETGKQLKEAFELLQHDVNVACIEWEWNPQAKIEILEIKN